MHVTIHYLYHVYSNFDYIYFGIIPTWIDLVIFFFMYFVFCFYEFRLQPTFIPKCNFTRFRNAIKCVLVGMSYDKELLKNSSEPVLDLN